jgi:hypothetical protein
MGSLHAQYRTSVDLHDGRAGPTFWEHSIPAVEAPRYSITFRTMIDRS